MYSIDNSKSRSVITVRSERSVVKMKVPCNLDRIPIQYRDMAIKRYVAVATNRLKQLDEFEFVKRG